MRLSQGMAAPAEGRFLSEARPHLNIEAPVCVYTARDPVSGRSMHLFEDLTVTRGATFCHVGTVIDRAQAEDIIDTLAQLHGTFMRDASGPTSRQGVDWLGTCEAFFQGALGAGIQEYHERAMTKAAGVIPERVLVRRDDVWAAAMKAVGAHSELPRTVIHSDVHLGNWYVTADGRMGLSDWARVCRGTLARDISYMLATTLSVESRRAWEEDLLQRYLENLRRDFGVEIDPEAARRMCHQQTFTALLMWTPSLCPPPQLPDMQPESVSMEMIRRIAIAIDDYGALESAD